MENHVRHQFFTIKQLSNKELLFKTKLLFKRSGVIHIKVLRHLRNRFPQAVFPTGILKSF